MKCVYLGLSLVLWSFWFSWVSKSWKRLHQDYPEASLPAQKSNTKPKSDQKPSQFSFEFNMSSCLLHLIWQENHNMMVWARRRGQETKPQNLTCPPARYKRNSTQAPVDDHMLQHSQCIHEGSGKHTVRENVLYPAQMLVNIYSFFMSALDLNPLVM